MKRIGLIQIITFLKFKILFESPAIFDPCRGALADDIEQSNGTVWDNSFPGALQRAKTAAVESGTQTGFTAG